jgi:hypothetical protein
LSPRLTTGSLPDCTTLLLVLADDNNVPVGG